MKETLKSDYRVERNSPAWPPEPESWGAVVGPAREELARIPSQNRDRLLSRLTPGQRALLPIVWLEAETYNGGLLQFLDNWDGRWAEDALNGLRLIGATEYSSLLEQALGLFPDRRVLNHRTRKSAALRRISPEEMEALFDAPFQTLNDAEDATLGHYAADFISQRPSDFFLPAGTTEADVAPLLPPPATYRLGLGKSSSLAGAELVDAIVTRLWNGYAEYARASRLPEYFAALTAGQQAILSIGKLHSHLQRSECLEGFGVFGGDLLESIFSGYALLGAEEHLQALRQALAVFGPEISSPDLAQRDRARTGIPWGVKQAAETTYANRFRQLEAAEGSSFKCLAERYIRAHPKEFFGV